MSKHHISAASEVFQGAANYIPMLNDNEGRRGAPVTFMTKVDMGTPIVADPDGISDGHDGTAVLTVALDGTLASGGAVTLDVPRTISIDTNSAGDTTQKATVTGTDVYGEPLVELIAFNGTTAVVGVKAFKTITSVILSAVLTDECDIGTTDALGLPFVLSDKSNLLSTWFAGVDEATLPTIVLGVTTDPATNVTGDVRGTIDVNSTLDGTKQIYLYMVVDSSTKVLLAGVDQFGG